jgi:hypothetical protein
MPDDEIWLTVPADADLEPVVVAALGALARGAGFPIATVDAIRETAATAYLKVLERGHGDVVEIEAWARRPEWFFEIRGSGWTETHQMRSGG